MTQDITKRLHQTGLVRRGERYDRTYDVFPGYHLFFVDVLEPVALEHFVYRRPVPRERIEYGLDKIPKVGAECAVFGPVDLVSLLEHQTVYGVRVRLQILGVRRQIIWNIAGGWINRICQTYQFTSEHLEQDSRRCVEVHRRILSPPITVLLIGDVFGRVIGNSSLVLRAAVERCALFIPGFVLVVEVGSLPEVAKKKVPILTDEYVLGFHVPVGYTGRRQEFERAGYVRKVEGGVAFGEWPAPLHERSEVAAGCGFEHHIGVAWVVEHLEEPADEGVPREADKLASLVVYAVQPV